MDCPEFRSLFSDFVDGALGAADVARCRAHVAACAACRRLEAAYRAGVAALRDLDPPSPTRNLSVRILHRVRREPRIAILAGGYGLAAALLVATFVGVVAVDVRGHRQAVAGPLGADTAPGPEVAPAGGLDLITVQVRDIPAYYLPTTPYVVVPATDADPAFPVRFEVPAVWSGR